MSSVSVAIHIAKGVPKNLLFYKLNFYFEKLHYSAGEKVKMSLPSAYVFYKGDFTFSVGKWKCFKICYIMDEFDRRLWNGYFKKWKMPNNSGSYK